MMVIPLKWFPWLILIVGIVVMVGGEAGTGLIMTAIGAAWLFLRSRSKQKNAQSSAGSRNQAPPPVRPTGSTNSTAQTDQRAAFCPSCGARVDSNAAYCVSCGHKLS